MGYHCIEYGRMKKNQGLKWQWHAMFISIVITVVIYVALSLYAGWHDISKILMQIGWWGLMIALILSLLNYFLRFIRWQYYLYYLGYSIAYGVSWRIYLSGFALTTTPGKAGEMVRSIFLTQKGIPASVSVAAFISERLSDLIAIVLISCIGLLAYPSMRIPILISIILILICWAGLMYPPITQLLCQIAQRQTNVFGKLLEKIIGILTQIKKCHNIKILSLTTILSVVAWSMEAWAFYWLLYWCDVNVNYQFAFFVYAVSMLVGALSFLPGGLGGAEATMISLLVYHGVDTHTALAITLFIRLTTLWFAVVLDSIAFVRQSRDKI